MKHSITLSYLIGTAIFSAVISIACLSCSRTKSDSEKNFSSTKSQRLNEVVVYTYDSFAGEWGAGPALAQKFEEQTGYRLTFLEFGDAVHAYNRTILEKNSPQADVLLGIDNNMCEQAIEAGILEPYKPKNADTVLVKGLEETLGNEWYLTPYDYSHFAIIYNTESSIPEPVSLEDLTDSIYKKKIILMDPRTSTPGLGFLAWTVAVYGDDAVQYWKRLSPNLLTMTAGWSEGWGMFLQGEAPLVISYTTSPAYNVETDNDYRFKTLIFEQGHVQQVEALGVIKGAPNADGARAFVDFMITQDAQNELPLTQWMYPAINGIELPKSYQEAAPKAPTTLNTDSHKVKDIINEVIAVTSR